LAGSALDSTQYRVYMMGMADAQNKAGKVIPAAAERALAEAAARRKVAQARDLPKEIGGPKGPEPTRFGDWDVKGVTSDF